MEISSSAIVNTYILVRHAEAAWSEDENRPLSDRGYADAERVANVLDNAPIDLIISSPYLRARETIAPLSQQKNLEVHVEPDLRERKLSTDIVEDFYLAVKQTWADPTFAHPGGESNIQVLERGLVILKRLEEENDGMQIVLSTHGNFLAVLMQHFDPAIDYHFWKAMTFPDIYSLTIAHPEPPLITRLWD